MEEEIAALASAIADSQHTIDLILSNQYEAAKEFIRPKYTSPQSNIILHK